MLQTNAVVANQLAMKRVKESLKKTGASRRVSNQQAVERVRRLHDVLPPHASHQKTYSSASHQIHLNPDAQIEVDGRGSRRSSSTAILFPREVHQSRPCEKGRSGDYLSACEPRPCCGPRPARSCEEMHLAGVHHEKPKQSRSVNLPLSDSTDLEVGQANAPNIVRALWTAFSIVDSIAEEHKITDPKPRSRTPQGEGAKVGEDSQGQTETNLQLRDFQAGASRKTRVESTSGVLGIFSKSTDELTCLVSNSLEDVRANETEQVPCVLIDEIQAIDVAK